MSQLKLFQVHDKQHEILVFVPKKAHDLLSSILPENDVCFKVTRKRTTKYGDYKWVSTSSKHHISINENLNQYAFLITLLHEIAHYRVNAVQLDQNMFLRRKQKSHGIVWKNTFVGLIKQFLNKGIFPHDVEKALIEHIKHPTASSSSDIILTKALRKYDAPRGFVYVEDIDEHLSFKTSNGRVYIRGEKLRKRFKCVDAETKKIYLFSPVAEVYEVNSGRNF